MVRTLVFKQMRLLRAATSVWLLVFLPSSACLKLNPDYQLKAELQTLKPPPASLTSSEASSSTEENGMSDTNSGSASEDSSRTSSSGSTSSETAITSGSTGSTGPERLDVDFKDGVWTEIEVEHTNTTTPLEKGYALHLFFDHGQMVATQSARVDGEDLALVYVEGSQGYVLDRWIDPSSKWNEHRTMIWFPAQEKILPGQSVKGKYYLAMNSSVFGVAQDPKKIFPVYDTFAEGNIDADVWNDIDGAEGNSHISAIAEGISLSAGSSESSTKFRKLQSRWSGRYDGVSAEMRFRIPATVNQTCNRVVPMAFESESDQQVHFGIGLDTRDWKQVTSAGSPGQEQLLDLLAMRNEDGGWHRFALTWSGSKLGIWRDAAKVFDGSSSNRTVNAPDHTTLNFTISARAMPGTCSGSIRSTIDIDWVWLRHYEYPEPKLRIVK